MTYFGVLFTFILPPLLLLAVAEMRHTWLRVRRGEGVERKAYLVLLAHVLLALAYTTPWDNYLVASGVWWYDPNLVSGVRFGWVPLEEYLFFILQTLLTGLWTLRLLRARWAHSEVHLAFTSRERWLNLWLIGLWLFSTALLVSGWQPTTYLTLILSWALIPVLSQTLFGADILFARRKLLLAGIIPPTLYLWVVDALALRSGTWTIDPLQTTGVRLGNLPIEEMLFFLMTNVIIVCGMVLMLTPASYARLQAWRETWRAQPLGVWWQQVAERIWPFALIGWLLTLILTPIGVWIGGETTLPALVSAAVLVQAALSTVSLATSWSPRRLSKILLLVLLLTWVVEWIGKTSGFPFGRYTYTAVLQPQILGVPLLIPLAWWMMLPPAWGTAARVLHPLRQRLGRFYPLAFAALSGAAFTAWDLYLDPQMTAWGLWTWEQAGGYFGIPWQNFVGWWLSATTITLLLRPQHLPQGHLSLIYTLTWAFQAVGLGVFWGQPWPALVGFVAMGGFVILAWRREGWQWSSWLGRWWASFQARFPIP